MADVVGSVGLNVQPVTKGFKAKVEAAVKSAMRGVNTEIPIKGDFKQVQAEAQKVGTEVQGAFKKASKASDGALRDVGGAATFAPARVSAERASQGVANSFQGAARKSSRALSRIDDNGSFASLTKRAFALITALATLQIAATALKVSALFAVALPLTTSIVALIGALGPLLGLLGAVPGAVALVGAAFGTVALATRGVGEALKAHSEQTKKAIESARTTEDAQERVSDSARALAQAQKAAQGAQESLTRSRKQAREELEDLQLALVGAALGEEGARLALRQALEEQQELRGRMANEGYYDALALESADLRVRDAEHAVNVALEGRIDTQERASEAFAKGVEGSDVVVEAQQRILDSQEALSDATTALTRATEDAAKSNDVFKTSMDELSPAAQSLVNTLISFKPAMKDLSATAAAGLFPGVERGLLAMRPLFETLTPIIFGTGQVMGGFVEKLGEFLGSEGFRRDLAVIGENNNKVLKTLGDTLLSLIPAFTDIAVVAGPMVQALADMAKGWADNFRESVAVGRETGTLAAFFDKAVETLRKVLAILGNVGGAFKNIFGAAAPEGERILDSLVRITQTFENWTKRTRENGSLGNFFTTIRKAVGSLWDAFKEILPSIIDLFKALWPVVEPFLGLFMKLVKPLFENKEIFNSLISIIESLHPVADAMAGAIEKLAPAFANVFVALTPIIEPLARLAVILIEKVGVPVLLLIADAFVLIAEGIAKIAPGVIDALGRAIEAAAKWVNDDLLPALSDLWNWIEINILPQLVRFKNFVGDVITKLGEFKDYILSDVLPKLQELTDALSFGVLTALTSVRDFINNEVKPRLGELADAIGRISRESEGEDGTGGAKGALERLAYSAADVLGRAASGLGEILREDVFPAVDQVAKAVGSVLGLFESFAKLIYEVYHQLGILDYMLDVLRIGFNLTRDVLEGGLNFALDVFKSGLEGVERIGSVVVTVVDGIRNALDSLNRFLTDTKILEKIREDPGGAIGKVLGKVFDIAFAEGAIVTKPTVAMIGEAGKEVVLPLTNAKRTLELAHESGLFEVLAKATAGQSSSGAIPHVSGGSAGVVFGPGSVVVQFNGSVTPEDATLVGENIGGGIKRVMEAQEALNEARAI